MVPVRLIGDILVNTCSVICQEKKIAETHSTNPNLYAEWKQVLEYHKEKAVKALEEESNFTWDNPNTLLC